MKAAFRAVKKGGFIASTLAPANRSSEPRFSWIGGAVVISVLAGLAVIMRVVLAH